MKSLFITMEGIEACGKSTQAKLLYQTLLTQNIDAVWTREPGGTPVSEQIRSILLDPQNTEITPETELLLYLAARNQHTAQVILPALHSGKFVICDRYSDSTLAYQGSARKIGIDKIIHINNFATYGLVPDLTFIIDIPIEVYKERIKGRVIDRIEAESVDFHKTVREAFLDIVKSDERYVLIDGTKSIQEIQSDIWQSLAI